MAADDSNRERLKARRRRIGIALAILIVALTLTPQFRSLVTFPDTLRIAEGSSQELSLDLPFRVYVRQPQGSGLRLNGAELASGTWEAFSAPLAIESLRAGQYRLQVRLFGFVPFRNLTVDVVPSVEVYPGGQAIGVVLHSEGVLVIDHSAVTTATGDQYSPAREAGIKVGDLVLKINGTVVKDKDHVGELIAQAGKRGEPATLTINRDGELITRTVNPVYDVREHAYLIGLWIKDGAAGVGTLTFYDSATRKFAALGHMITDGRTQKPIQVQSGKIVQAQIAGIERGRQGQPGEKIGRFSDRALALGIIESNNRFGIAGVLDRLPDHPLFDRPVPVALVNEVREGPAEIVTVVEGRSLEKFQVTIERAMEQHVPQDKGLVIKVDDPALLKATGGIVQGMSGSPILQDGKLIGAVTHVFVNDPTRGYGVYAEWMLEETGLASHTQPRNSSVLP